jgi:RNA polymerase sigma-70 factor, ECF subfamily
LGEQKHDSSAALDLDRLFRTHASGLAGAVRGILGARADVQDVLQECFLRAWKALARGTTPRDPVAWVFVLTLNLARDLRRHEERRGKGLKIDEVDEVELAAREREPHALLEGREASSAARAAILKLEEDVRRVFLLRVSGDLSFEAIAEALGIPIGTAKTRMRTALRQLRFHLARFGASTESAATTERWSFAEPSSGGGGFCPGSVQEECDEEA